MEDAVDVQEDVAGFRLFAVYDGHAGDEAVSIIKKTLPDILRTHLQEEPDVEEAIRVAFRNTDEELMKTVLAAAPKPEEIKVSSGTVAVLAKDFWICNLGDCRAVLCTDGTKAKAVSADHGAEKNPAEAERLQKLGLKCAEAMLETTWPSLAPLGTSPIQAARR